MKSVIAASLLAAAWCAGASAAQAAPAGACAAKPVDLGSGVQVLHALRAYTGPDGATHVEEKDLTGVTATHMGTVKLTLWNLGTPTKASMVYGWPNVEIPVHSIPGREMFVVLSGSSEMRLLDGKVYKLKPGTLFVAEDVGSTGRGGKAGPCGYLALDLQYPYPSAAPVLPAPPPAP